MLELRAFKVGFRHPNIAFFVEETKNNVIYIGKPVVIEALDMATYKPYEEDSIQTTFNLCNAAAQKLIDDLWDTGLRPSEGVGSAGSFAAQGKHLKDLQRIVFRYYKGTEK